jgi:hypothetical protein
MATDSAQDVISRVKWTLDHEQQFEVYLTILETLAANYAEIWGQANLTWSNSPVSLVKVESRPEVNTMIGNTSNITGNA